MNEQPFYTREIFSGALEMYEQDNPYRENPVFLADPVLSLALTRQVEHCIDNYDFELEMTQHWVFRLDDVRAIRDALSGFLEQHE